MFQKTAIVFRGEFYPAGAVKILRKEGAYFWVKRHNRVYKVNKINLRGIK